MKKAAVGLTTEETDRVLTAGKSWVMYLHPTLGVSFGYLADGVWHDQAAPPLDVGDRAAFGAFSMDDAGHCRGK